MPSFVDARPNVSRPEQVVGSVLFDVAACGIYVIYASFNIILVYS